MGGTISYIEQTTYNMVNEIFNSMKNKNINTLNIIKDSNLFECELNKNEQVDEGNNSFVILFDGNIVGYTKRLEIVDSLIKKTKENMYLTYSCNNNYFYNWDIVNELNVDKEEATINNLSKLIYKAVFTRRLKNVLLSYESMIHSLEILQLKCIEDLIN